MFMVPKYNLVVLTVNIMVLSLKFKKKYTFGTFHQIALIVLVTRSYQHLKLLGIYVIVIY